MNFETHLLDKKYHRDSFTCEQPSLTTYLKVQASQDMKKNLALCFVVIDEKNQVAGYYTLSNASIPKAAIPEDIRNKFGYKDIPVTLLGRLARDQKHRSRGLGELLLMDALRRSVEASRNHSGSYALVTDPINENAEKFYAKYGFQKLADSKRMFIAMKTIEGLF